MALVATGIASSLAFFFAEIKSFERHILSTHIWSVSNFVNVEIPEISKFAIEILFS